LDLSIIQGPVSVAPCQTLISRFATFPSPYIGQDPYDNLLLQLSGEKHFTLFAPSQRWWLYPTFPPGGHESSLMNDIRGVDLARFPCFQFARPVTLTLRAGDVLLLPYAWWHQVRNHWSSRGGAESSLGDAKSSLGDATSSLGDATSSLGEAKSSLGDATSSLGDAKSSRGDAKSSRGDAKSSLGDAKSSLGDAKSSLGDEPSPMGLVRLVSGVRNAPSLDVNAVW
jgi:uncharacterized protein YjbJ (UPF0337 family)